MIEILYFTKVVIPPRISNILPSSGTAQFAKARHRLQRRDTDCRGVTRYPMAASRLGFWPAVLGRRAKPHKTLIIKQMRITAAKDDRRGWGIRPTLCVQRKHPAIG